MRQRVLDRKPQYCAGEMLVPQNALLAARKILLLEPIVSMTIDELVTYVAPTLQRYLTGKLD